MTIRHTNLTDLPRLYDIFATARRFMEETGNPHQWTDGYPRESFLLDDIERGDSFVCCEDGKVVGTFVLRGGEDPTYNIICAGAWPHNRPYATIHRIASSGEVKGVFAAAVDFALERYNTLRIDTHRDNSVMQHLVLKCGFKYCGIIHCWNGDERLAYQHG